MEGMGAYKIKQMEDVEAAARLGIPLNSTIFPSQGKGRGKKGRILPLLWIIYIVGSGGESVERGERMKRAVATDIARHIAIKRSRIFCL